MTATTALLLAATLYLLVILALVNYFVWRAYAGRRLQAWQATLAALPLRVLGYNEGNGDSICDVCCRRATRRLLLISIIVCATFATMLAFILIGSPGTPG